ncbi:MAG: ferritin-like domain-containing protein [Williamsia sp.]|nr:ferritin-like domain-containing protein [Williamsia sp.]
MNLDNIFNEIEKVDPEVYGRLDSRRAAMKSFARTSGKMALAAVPLAFGSMLQKAYAGTRSVSDSVVEILNYALTLEFLEAEFYNTGLMTTGLLAPGDVRSGIEIIAKHENAHVKYLQTTIMKLGGTPTPKPTFDFSGGSGSGNGPFKGLFNSLDLFLSVAQTFEDTGVRAYKGRAMEIVGGGDVLTAALQIHSVEARHAAYLREIRKTLGSGIGNVKPWITGNISGINSQAVQPNYNGEDVTTQSGINIVGINGFPISFNAATEAFDEPLSKADVLAIVTLFIKP